jgi:hypothetical protein
MGRIANAWYGNTSYFYVEERKYNELKTARDAAIALSRRNDRAEGIEIEDRDHQVIEKWKDGKKVG